MMIGVAEPNESQSTNRKTDETARAGPAREPEVVDAEIVETASSGDTGGGDRGEPRSAGPRDDEEFRQYQQFLEFQKFQEWQRQQGGGTAPGPTTAEPKPGGRRWWYYARKILSFKPVRRLLYLVIAVLLVLWAINSTFSSGDDSSGHVPAPGNQDPGISPARSTDPKQASIALYHYLASSSPETACKLFSPPGQQAFAGAVGVPDCTAAAQRVHARVTNPTIYGNPDFGENAMKVVGDQALIDSCSMTAEGGPRLGKFRLARQYNGGWLIDRYAAPTC